MQFENPEKRAQFEKAAELANKLCEIMAEYSREHTGWSPYQLKMIASLINVNMINNIPGYEKNQLGIIFEIMTDTVTMLNFKPKSEE